MTKSGPIMIESAVIGPLENENRATIAALSVAKVAAISQTILSALISHWQMTALVVEPDMYEYPDQFDDICDVFK